MHAHAGAKIELSAIALNSILTPAWSQVNTYTYFAKLSSVYRHESISGC